MNLGAVSGSAEFHRLGFADALSLSPECFHVVVLAARGAQLEVPSGWASAWWVLRGELGVRSSTFQGQVAEGYMLTWQDGAIKAFSAENIGAIAIAAPVHLWQQHANEPKAIGGRLLMPWQVRPNSELRRLILRVARLARRGNAPHEAVLRALVAAVHESQEPMRACLEKVRAGNRQRREQVLFRLMRLRHLLVFGQSSMLGLAGMSKVANYSPTHLIRLYREVFGETPLEHANRLRIGRSWALLRGTHMSVGEVSKAIGFESKSAFCRSFKTNFGTTASQVRRVDVCTR